MTRMYRYYYLAIACLMLIFYGCDKAVPTYPVNPYDPSSPYFMGNPTRGLTLTSVDMEKINLTWKSSSIYSSGFLIEKKNLKTNTTTYFTKDKNDTFLEDTVNILQKYKYRIATRTNTEYRLYSDSLNIEYKPYSLFSQTSDYTYTLKNYKSQRIFSDGTIYQYYNGYFDVIRKVNYYYPLLSEDGKHIIFNEADRTGYYDIDNDREYTFKYPDGTPDSIKKQNARFYYMSQDGQYMLGMRNVHNLLLWNVRTGDVRTIYCDDVVSSGIISSDNRFIVSMSLTYLYIWDLNTLQVYAKLLDTYNNPLGKIVNYNFTNDGSKLIYYYAPRMFEPGTLNLFDLKTKSYIYQLPFGTPSTGNPEINLLAGDQFLEESYDRKIRLWKLDRNLKPVTVYYTMEGWYKRFLFTNRWEVIN